MPGLRSITVASLAFAVDFSEASIAPVRSGRLVVSPLIAGRVAPFAPAAPDGRDGGVGRDAAEDAGIRPPETRIPPAVLAEDAPAPELAAASGTCITSLQAGQRIFLPANSSFRVNIFWQASHLACTGIVFPVVLRTR